MNCNEFTYYPNYRGRNRNFRGRGVRAVNIQRPTIGGRQNISTRKSSSTNVGSNTSSIKWKNKSSLSFNNVTTTVTRSISSKTFSTSYCDSKVVIAIAAGRGEAAYEIGIAAVDICKPTLIMCQISDTPSYINTLTKINILNPDEILIPMTFVDTASSNRLVNKIKEYFTNVTITAVPRASYNKTTGLQFIKELCAPEWDSIFIILEHKYYCLTAASALLTYTESSLFVIYNQRSLKVEYQESEGYCIIDVSTADKLELVDSNSVTANEKYSSLYGILSYCLTKIGTRTLRAAILQPSCSVPDIEARLDCIAELKKNSNMMMSVQTILPKIANIDNLLSLATLPSEQGDNFTERHLSYVLTLNVFLDILEPLREVFLDSEQPFFKEIRSTLDSKSFNDLKSVVRSTIQPDAHPAKGQQGIIEKCFVIKPGVNGLLDVLRKTYSERVEDLREYVTRLRDKYNLPLTLSNNHKKGYHISLQLNAHTKRTFKKSELPAEFIQVERLYSSVTMKTTNLINLAARIDDILQETLKMSSVLVYEILVKVRNHIGLFYKLCEEIAKLDLIQSLAQASSGIGYIRPTFGDYLEITNSRHPLLDFLCSTEPISNSIFASGEHNVHMITGPNGSGKSIFIRQVLLLQVMAQIGSFIPAETAVVRVCDRMLARVYFDDNMDCGASAFVLEVKEIQYFRTVMTSNTLIIIDELCRSTALSEGTALAMAMLESLSKSQAFIFLATHYIFVTKLEEFYPNVTNWQMETIADETRHTPLRFTYSLISGITAFKKYGLCAASVSWPRDIVEIAEGIYNGIKPPKQHAKVEGLHILNRLRYNLEAELKMVKSKKQLTWDILQGKIAAYAENLKAAGLDIVDYMSKDTFSEDDNKNSTRNISFPTSKSAEFEMTNRCIYPEVIYSTPGTNPDRNDENLEGYDRFCHGIEAKNLEMEHVHSLGEDVRSDGAISCMISQNIDRIIEENRQNENGRDSEAMGDFHDVSALNSFQNPNSFIPWRSNTSSNVRTGSENRTGLIWKSPEESAPIQDPDVTTALEDLQECSSYFTQEWDELGASAEEILEEPNATPLNNESGLENDPKSNVIIHSVHIFAKNDELLGIQRFDPDTGVLVEVNSFNTQRNGDQPQQGFFEEHEGLTNYSSNKELKLPEQDGDSISVNNPAFLISQENIYDNDISSKGFNQNFEHQIEDHENTSLDRSFTANFTNENSILNKTNFSKGRIEPEPQLNLSNASFRIKFQTHSSKIETSFLKPAKDIDFFPNLARQSGSVTSSNNTFYSLCNNTDDIRQSSLKSSYKTHNNSTPFNQSKSPTPNNKSQVENREKEPCFEIFQNNSTDPCFNEGQKQDRSLIIGESVADSNNSWFSAIATDSVKSAGFNRKDFGKKTFSHTFYEIQARNDALRLLKSNEIAAKSDVEPMTSDRSEKTSFSNKVVSEVNAKSSNKSFQLQNEENSADNLETIVQNRGIVKVNRNVLSETCENTFNSSCSTLKLYQNRSINNSIVSQSKKLEIPKQDNHNLFKTSSKDDEVNSKIFNKAKHVLEESNSLKSPNINHSKIVFSGTKPNFYVENDKIRSEIKISSPNLVSGNICLNKTQKDENIKLECKTQSNYLNDTGKDTIDSVEASQYPQQSTRFQEFKKTFSHTYEIQARNARLRLLKSNEIAAKSDVELMTSDVQPMTNSIKSTGFNPKDFGKKTFSHTFYEIQARNDALRLLKSNETAAKSDVESIASDRPEETSFSNKVVSDLNAKSPNKSFQMQYKENSADNLETIVQNGAIVKVNRNVCNDTCENTFDSFCSTLKLYQNRSFNTSIVSQSKKLENPKQDNHNLFKTSSKEVSGVNTKIFNKDKHVLEEGNSLKSPNINHSQIAFSGTKPNFFVENDEIRSETKISSPNLVSDNICLSKTQKDEDTKLECKIQSNDLNDTGKDIIDSMEAAQYPEESTRFQKLSKSLKRYFKPAESAEIPKEDKPKEINDESSVIPNDDKSNIFSLNSNFKSQPKSIFECSNGSESLFSSPEALFNDPDISYTKPKTPGKSSAKNKIRKRKFVTPLKTTVHLETSIVQRRKADIRKASRKTQFVPPKMLSKKEIIDDFDRQRKRILENSDDPDRIEEYMKFICNRPNIQQIQGQKYLAMIKRTDDGVLVIPASNPVVKNKTVVSLKRKLSWTGFPKILSDENEDKLNTLLQTQEKVFNFDDCKSNLELSKEKVKVTPRTLDLSTPSSSSIFDMNKNVIDDIIKKYLDD